MQHIDIRQVRLRLPQDWEGRAAAALEKVRAAQPDKRSAEVAKYAGLWSELKPILRDLSGGKCWYCESRQNRSDNAVDHFRPKNQVLNVADHPGYWWKAFEWKNYRYACTFCNSRRVDLSSGAAGGKHDEFPLLNPADRGYPEDSCDHENPVLLDPCCAADTLTLYFRQDGHVELRPEYSEAKDISERLSESIRLYHLAHGDLVDARASLFNEIEQLIELGRAYHADWKAGDAKAKVGFDTAVSKLKALSSPSAEFSAAAKDMIRGFRDNKHPWIDTVV